MQCRVFVFVAAVASVTIALSAAPAASQNLGRAGRSQATAVPDAWNDPGVGRDISFPQCGGPMPALQSAVLGVLGTNDGTSFTRNRCLVTELAWAKRLMLAPAFYANTGNPGPLRTRHWPLGQAIPKVCGTSDPNSLACSYDYGWNSGWHSYNIATDAAQRLHHVDRGNARHRAANVDWWLDVETMNSWQSVEGSATLAAQRRDAAALAGEIDALRISGVARVGVYSTQYQWDTITGGSKVTSRFADTPQWLAGYGSHAAAVAGCDDRGFTRGEVRMTQYLGADGFDADVVCSGPAGD